MEIKFQFSNNYKTIVKKVQIIITVPQWQVKKVDR